MSVENIGLLGSIEAWWSHVQSGHDPSCTFREVKMFPELRKWFDVMKFDDCVDCDGQGVLIRCTECGGAASCVVCGVMDAWQKDM